VWPRASLLPPRLCAASYARRCAYSTCVRAAVCLRWTCLSSARSSTRWMPVRRTEPCGCLPWLASPQSVISLFSLARLWLHSSSTRCLLRLNVPPLPHFYPDCCSKLHRQQEARRFSGRAVFKQHIAGCCQGRQLGLDCRARGLRRRLEPSRIQRVCAMIAVQRGSHISCMPRLLQHDTSHRRCICWEPSRMRVAFAAARRCEQALFILRPLPVRPSIVIAMMHTTLLFSIDFLVSGSHNVATGTTREKSAQAEKSCSRLR